MYAESAGKFLLGINYAGRCGSCDGAVLKFTTESVGKSLMFSIITDVFRQ